MAAKRQLALPGMRLRGRPAPRRPLAAKRDMTAAEFARALAAFGFSSTAGGLRFVDDASGAAFDGVRNHARGRLARRATLSKILRERNRGSDR